MLLVALNAVFAGIFLSFAFAALRHAIPLVRVGWLGIQTAVEKPDYREDIESRRRINEAGWLLIGGIVWSTIALGAAIFGLGFAYRLAVLYV